MHIVFAGVQFRWLTGKSLRNLGRVGVSLESEVRRARKLGASSVQAASFLVAFTVLRLLLGYVPLVPVIALVLLRN